MNETEMLKELVVSSINSCYTRQNNDGDNHNVALARLEIIEDKVKKYLGDKGIKINTFYDEVE